MTWTQTYTPLGNLYLSALVAALPVIVLLGALAFFHVKAHWAALLGLGTALLIAIELYGMPGSMAMATVANGAAYGLFPIGWIVLNAIFVYDVTVKTGKFEVVKDTIAGLASDRRIQVLLIGFSFGAFIEGAAGFGTPVAISAAMLIGLGFKPLHAAGLALIGNTAPVAYGALGTPIIVLAKVTNLPLDQISAMVGRQLPFFSVIVPFWLVWAMSGFRGMKEVWPACLVAGVSFAIPQFLVSNFHGPWVVDIVASATSIASVVVLLRFWQPQKARSLDCLDAVDNPLRVCLCLGLATDEKLAQWVPQPQLEGTLAAQSCPASSARRAQALAGASGLQPQLSVRHWNWTAARRHCLRTAAQSPAARAGQDLSWNAQAGAFFAAHHCRNARPWIHHPLCGLGRHDGARVRIDRTRLPVLLGDAGLVGRGPHRERHLFQRPLRKPAAGHRSSGRHLAGVGGCDQQLWRRDGEDDRRAKHRRCRGCHWPAGAGRIDPPVRLLPQRRACGPGRLARVLAGLRFPGRRSALSAVLWSGHERRCALRSGLHRPVLSAGRARHR